MFAAQWLHSGGASTIDRTMSRDLVIALCFVAHGQCCIVVVASNGEYHAVKLRARGNVESRAVLDAS